MSSGYPDAAELARDYIELLSPLLIVEETGGRRMLTHSYRRTPGFPVSRPSITSSLTLTALVSCSALRKNSLARTVALVGQPADRVHYRAHSCDPDTRLACRRPCHSGTFR